MNFNQLEYFRELIRSGSFSAASEKLGISQPALSTQIRKLEEEADLVLVNRNSRPVKLTPDGERYLEISNEILERVDYLKELPTLLADDISCTLKIGIIPTLAPYLLTMFMDILKKQYPNLELIVEEMLTEDIILNIRTGHLDAGLISTPVDAGKLHFMPLFYEKFYLYLSEKHAFYHRSEIALHEIDEDDIWYLREGNCFTNQVNSICRLAGHSKSELNLSYYTNSIESLRRIVEREHGLTFIPELATINIPLEYEDMIKQIAGNQPVREISMVSTSHLVKNRQLEAVIKVLLSQLPPHMLQKPGDWIVDTNLKV